MTNITEKKYTFENMTLSEAGRLVATRNTPFQLRSMAAIVLRINSVRPNIKLTIKRVIQIREALRDKTHTPLQLSKIFCVSLVTIGDVKRYRTLKHVTIDEAIGVNKEPKITLDDQVIVQTYKKSVPNPNVKVGATELKDVSDLVRMMNGPDKVNK